MKERKKNYLIFAIWFVSHSSFPIMKGVENYNGIQICRTMITQVIYLSLTSTLRALACLFKRKQEQGL